MNRAADSGTEAMLGRRRGRPPSAILRPEHADVLRRAIKAAARYFGVRIADLSAPSKWIVDAMRKAKPMTVTVAQHLVDVLERPDARLIGAKPPQGMPLSAVFQAMISSGNEKVLPKQDAALEYLAMRFLTARIMERYLAALPGSVIFVLPGGARAATESLLARIPTSVIAKSKRKAAFSALLASLEDAERPLETDLGRRLEPRLVYLGMFNNLRVAESIQKQFPDLDVLGLAGAIEAMSEAEKRRADAVGSPGTKSRPRGRRVVMPKVREMG